MTIVANLGGMELTTSRKALLGVISMSVGFLLFSSTGRDDSHITYWAAHMLSSTGEIVNYNGERIEQSSSLALVILLAALDKILPLPLPTIGALVSIVGGAVTVILTQSLAATICPRISLLAGLLTGCSASLMYWSFGGLETTWAAYLGTGLLIGYARVLREGWGKAATMQVISVTCLFLLVRPEAIAVAVSVLLGGIVLLLCRSRLSGSADSSASREAIWRMLGLLGLVAVISLGIVAFRSAYFGAIFPQPVAAKAGGLTRAALRDGSTYLAQQLRTGYGVVLWALAACGIGLVLYKTLIARRFSAPELLIALFALAYTAFIVLAGGDWMEGGRFLVPMLPMVAIMGVLFVERVAPRMLLSAGVLLLCLQIVGTLSLARSRSTGRPLWTTGKVDPASLAPYSWFDVTNRVHYRDLLLVPSVDDTIRKLNESGISPVTFMSCQMGTVPYYLGLAHFGHVRFLDICGLIGRDFTDCRLTAWLPRSRYGLRLSFDFFFEHRRQLSEICGIGEPDIIYALDRLVTLPNGHVERLEESFRRNGYTSVYHQLGTISTNSELLPGDHAPSTGFLAVRNDLVRIVSEPRARHN